MFKVFEWVVSSHSHVELVFYWWCFYMFESKKYFSSQVVSLLDFNNVNTTQAPFSVCLQLTFLLKMSPQCLSNVKLFGMLAKMIFVSSWKLTYLILWTAYLCTCQLNWFADCILLPYFPRYCKLVVSHLLTVLLCFFTLYCHSSLRRSLHRFRGNCAISKLPA